MIDLIIKATLETLVMVSLSLSVSCIIGIPLGMMLFNSSIKGMSENTIFYNLLALAINTIRSVPYIILTILLIPFSRFLIGTSIGIYAAIIPLSIGGIMLVARVVEDALSSLPQGLIETGYSMSATKCQIMCRILLPEALPNIIASITMIAINLIGFSAMAGAVGGGGLGDLAIRYGYQRYNIELLVTVVIILIILVQLVQLIGDKLVKVTRK